MSEAIQIRQPQGIAQYSQEQRDLIKRTVAPGATDDELAMFLHVAAKSGLDPLLKQVHFIKVQNRMTVVADINGLQARAAREADYVGIDHAVVYEKDEFVFDNVAGKVVKHTNNPLGVNGRIIGAWAIVTRRDKRPFCSVVRFDEYLNQFNALWKTKPAVMIDKCAKSTALRLAYPEQLGSVYEEAELGKEEETEVKAAGEPVVTRTEEVKQKLEQKLAARALNDRAEDPPQSGKPLTPWERIQVIGREYGKEGKELGGLVKGVLGKAKPSTMTDGDVETVAGALRALAGEVPMPSDSDAPPEEDVPF